MRKATLLPQVLVLAGYALFGPLSVPLAPYTGFAILLFLPAGISLVATLLFGRSMAIPIFFGAIATQAAIYASHQFQFGFWGWLTILVSAVGAVLQARLGAFLARRLVGLPANPLDRPGAILMLFGVVAPFACLLNASLSIPVMIAAGVLPALEGPINWWNWWLGDTLGVILALPLLLVFFGQPPQAWRPRRVAVAVPMALAGILAALAVDQTVKWDQQRTMARFQREAERLAGLMTARLSAHIDMVLAIRNWANITERVDGRSFRAITSPWLTRYAGTQAFGWSPLVTRAERDRFELAQRAEGQLDFTINGRDSAGNTFPEHPADIYLPLAYVEPLQTNRKVIGLNVLHYPVTGSAALTARDTGFPAATEPIRLVAEHEQQLGVVVYQAVYDGDEDLPPETRRLRGVISATFRVGEIMQTTLADFLTEGLEVCLIATSAEISERHLYGPHDCESPDYAGAVFTRSANLAFAGRIWEMRVIATSKYIQDSRSWLAWATVVSGLLGLGLLGAFLLISSGATRRIAGVVAERTAELTSATERLQAQQTTLTDAQRIAHVGSWEWRAGQTHIECSEEMKRLLEIGEQPLALEDLPALFHRDDASRVAEALRQATGHSDKRQLEVRPRNPSAAAEVLHIQIEGLTQLGCIAALRGTVQDITTSRKAEAHIHYLAHYDTLTGLPNRNHWMQRAKAAIATADPQQQLIAVLFLDLDRFKMVNDSLGHPVGDKLLAKVASRLSGCLRSDDLLARLGGDEFVVLVEQIQHADEAGAVADKMLTVFREPFDVGGQQLTLGASIGIALFPEDSQDIDTLLQQADVAMYGAKENGRNTHEFFTQDMTIRASERLRLEADLRRALEQGQFELYFQPQVDARTNRLVGAESLIRWHHPTRGLIAPSTFIPIAEESGLVIPIGHWVLETLFQQRARWHRSGMPAIRLAANISAIQFGKENFIAQIEQLLQETGADPAELELELTESVLMNLDHAMMARLGHLRDMGFALALDDFGVGYSSLGYLKRLPITRLKIDRSFIVHLPEDQEDAAITLATLSMANNLGLEIVAEGVDDDKQKNFLIQRGCFVMQGYLFSKPLSAYDFEAFVRQHGCEAPGSI